jgi:hypothetical protein
MMRPRKRCFPSNDPGKVGGVPRNDEARYTPGYAHPVREDDPYHTVRTIGRVCQMLLELRDEYERRPRADLLDQIEQRLNDLVGLRVELRERRNLPAHEE